MATKPDNTPKTNSDEALIENNHEAENFQIRQKDSTSRVNTSERSEPAFQEEPSDMSFLALQREAGTSEDIISVKDFGAKGDGRTNDTAAFQNAINFFAQGGTGNAVKHIFIPAGHYKVTGNILIPATANSLLFYGTGPRVSIIEDTVSDAHGALFISEIFSVFFQNLQIRNSVNTSSSIERNGVLFKRPFGAQADIDAQFSNCVIRGFSSGIRCVGRGLKVNDCTFSLCKRCIELDWPDEGDYTPGNQFVQDDAHGYRGFQFTDCRFHSVRTGVTNYGRNAKKIRGMLISGCLQDIGRPLFEGVLRHSVINGCIVDMNTVYALHLMDGSENYLISNCNFMGRVDPEHPEQTPGSLIQIRGNQRSGVFTGLNLRNCSRHAIDIREGKFENGIFDAISMENIAMSTKDASVRGSYAGITFVGDYGHQAVVRGLSVDSHENTQAAISVGYASSNVTFFDVVTSGSIPIYYGSGCRTGQSAIMSGDDSAYLEFIDRTKIARGKIGSATVGKRGLLLEAGDTGPVIIANSLRPLDGSVSIGSTNYPFNYVVCQQVVQSSDETLKQDIAPVSAAIREAWEKVFPKVYRMRAETERLGDKAPQTAGYIAQDIITAFDSVGLDAIALGVVHADADADGNVTYGINYTVANILASCCNTARIASLNERISQLEESLSRISLM